MTEGRKGRGFSKADVGKVVPCLSLSNPWPWTIFDAVELSKIPGVGMKRIENRSWWFWYRGPCWLCTSATTTTERWNEAVDHISRRVADFDLPERMPAGVVRGLVMFTGSRWSPTELSRLVPWEFRSPPPPMKPNCAAKFEVLKVLERPIHIQGMQGFWRPPAHIAPTLDAMVQPDLLKDSSAIHNPGLRVLSWRR